LLLDIRRSRPDGFGKAVRNRFIDGFLESFWGKSNMEIMIVAMVVLSAVVGLCGINRKFGFWGYFFASLLMTPAIGILLVLASSPPVRK
jgi:hypothetical protein